MRKYTVAHSFLMITSVFASTPPYVIRRQGGVITVSQPGTTQAQSSPAQASTTSASQPASTNPVATTVVSSTPPSSTPTSASTPTTSATLAPTVSTSSSVSSSPLSPLSSSSVADTTTAITSTNAQGSPVTVIVSATPSTTPPASSSAPASSDSGSTNISSGTIIGLSVAGGIAALAIIGFIVWKLTRKRFSDLDDPDEAIKWPELNRESETGGMNGGLSRQLSGTYSNTPSRNASTFDQSDPPDPYAVPPLPQFNPNQPYRDDPYAASNAGFYDPYRGPIPQTFHDGSIDGHENIPMSTYPVGSRSRSPGPGMAYDMGGRGSPAPGRASPALGQGYDMGGRGSPAPGRTISPGPAAALGLDRRPTPSVQSALSGPPEMANRTRSPGPNVLG